MAISNYRVAHEVPGRVRFQIPILGAPGYEASYVEDWMEAVASVTDVRANPAAKSLIVQYKGGSNGREAVIRRLKGFSREVIPGYGDDGSLEAEIAPMATTLMTLAALPLLTPGLQKLVTFVKVGSTLAKGADVFINKGVKMEVLDALAIGLAAANGEVYTANITNFLLSLGEYLERRTQRQSDRLLRRLLRPKPAMAWVEREGELVQVNGDDVAKGEIVVVGVGETVPVDGRVVEGVALVNQAAVTGEDVPVRKESPKRVISGSVLEDGRIRVEATHVGADTTTARVSRFIQESLSERSNTQRLADELADKRVYLTLGTGGVVYALTQDLTRLQSVFLVDYSCALKLGTPVAFKSGIYRAAEHGVLMKGGEAIEQLAEIDTLIFDKTGTLTHSELIVTDVLVLARDARCCTNEDLLALVASVEEHAKHPIAEAVVEAAKERDLKHISHGEVDYLVAHGMSADVKGARVIVGSRHYLEEHKDIHFAQHERQIAALNNAGKILLFVGNDQGPIGIIALRDTMRKDAPSALARLRGLGVENLMMITGDRRAKGEALGAQLGLDDVYAELAPEDKAAVVKHLQKSGKKVGFVGDGVNDGPALAAADVGVAMPRGADIARATADIVLLDDRLSAVADAREVASRTMDLIRWNFTAAVGINTGILGAAILGRLSPVVSALLHNGTTIGILLNALKGVRISGEDDRILAQKLPSLKDAMLK